MDQKADVLMSFNTKRTWGPTPRYERVKRYKRLDDKMIVVAGPCSVETPEQIFNIAESVFRNGATHLRGGVFRAGTYPPEKGFGIAHMDLVKAHQRAAHHFGMKNIMEVLDYDTVPLMLFDKYADCLQIGSRSMQNYTLLKKVAELKKPVFLKRNQGATLDELLGAAEYLLKFSNGECHPVIIERGSSTFLDHVRWDLSISMIPAVKRITEIPIIVDGSHGTGRRDLVASMNMAGIAAGADGLLCEVHYDPENSLSDPDQAITPREFGEMMEKVVKIRQITRGE